MPLLVDVSTLGVQVTPMTASEVADEILKSVVRQERLWIGNHNLHGVYQHHIDPRFRLYNDSCDLVLIDGWPVWAAARLASKDVGTTATRIGSSDWLATLLETEAPLRICAIGGTEESSVKARLNIMRKHPHVMWEGYDGYSTSGSSRSQVRESIKRADIVLVGMGMPRQEKWILDNASELDCKVVANIGGCLDYFAGTQKHAPRWLGRIGLEWLYRLAASPRRLARRYLVEPFQLAVLIMTKRRIILEDEQSN